MIPLINLSNSILKIVRLFAPTAAVVRLFQDDALHNGERKHVMGTSVVQEVMFLPHITCNMAGLAIRPSLFLTRSSDRSPAKIRGSYEEAPIPSDISQWY